jgi:hypothetical protein
MLGGPHDKKIVKHAVNAKNFVKNVGNKNTPRPDMGGNHRFVLRWLWADGALGESKNLSIPMDAGSISLPSRFGKASGS